MKPEVCQFDSSTEHLTDERCFIVEVANDPSDPSASIARARVAPGVSTKFHKVVGTEERYIIVEGEGVVEIGELAPAKVVRGDVVRIPADVRQRITNSGAADLVFFCVCTPRFRQEAYVDLEESCS